MVGSSASAVDLAAIVCPDRLAGEAGPLPAREGRATGPGFLGRPQASSERA